MKMIRSYEEFMEPLAKNVDKEICYSEYVAEKVEKNISYSEYIAENLDRVINTGMIGKSGSSGNSGLAGTRGYSGSSGNFRPTVKKLFTYDTVTGEKNAGTWHDGVWMETGSVGPFLPIMLEDFEIKEFKPAKETFKDYFPKTKGSWMSEYANAHFLNE